METLSDLDLTHLARDGDAQAYARIVARYQSLVFGVAYHQLERFEDARDVAQDVFIQAFLRLGQLRDGERLGAWLRQIAVNECRAWQRRRRPTLPLDAWEGAADDGPRTETRVLVHQALARLDEASRLAVTLFYLHAYSMQEIGEFLGEPVTTIKSRLRNARLKLRKEMTQMIERSFEDEALPPDFAARVAGLIEAAHVGDVSRVQAMLDADPRLVRGTPTTTPLHRAAAAGQLAVVDLLLASGADPNALDEGDHASPLHYAAERGHLEVVRRLVEAGADVGWNRDVHERGPLGWATIFGTVHTDVAEYLLAHGARFDIFSAIALGREDVVRSLAAADPGVLAARMSACEDDRSPILFAIATGRRELAERLVELGAPVGLREAVALDWRERVEEELATADPAALAPAFRSAVEGGRPEIVRLLLEAGADPRATDEALFEGRSPIFFAIERRNEAIARLLLEFGADIDERDTRWNSTPLGWEVFFGRPEGVRLALKLGAKADPHLAELARDGEAGKLRAWSEGTPSGYREVAAILAEPTAER
jgi:RNA polymerase sigma-70 factor (ECF subfamily)